MQFRLKTKITLTTAALVLAVVGVNSALYMMNLTRQVIRQAEDRAHLASQQVFFQTQIALAEAAKAGKAPESDTPEGLRAYAQDAFRDSASLADSINAQLSFSKLLYEISITDVNGIVLVSSDKNLPGNPEPVRAPITQLLPGSIAKQMKVLYQLIYGPLMTYEV